MVTENGMCPCMVSLPYKKYNDYVTVQNCILFLDAYRSASFVV